MMNISLVLCRWSLVAGLMAMPILAFTAETATKTEALPAPPATKETLDIRIDLDIFQGKIMGQADDPEATLENIAKVWRDQFNLNIVLAPGTAKLRIADLRLRRSSLNDALYALMVAGDGQFAHQIKKPESPADSGSATLVTFMGRSQPKREVEVFNLTPYFQSAGIFDLQADARQKRIDEALKQISKMTHETMMLLLENRSEAQDDPMPGINFHQGANLLVVTGTDEAINVVRKIVNALNQEERPKQPDRR